MYRPLILFVLLICIYPSQSSIETEVQELIKKLQDAIPEPVNITEANILIPDNKLISGFLNLSNFNATGLKAFDLKVNFVLGTVPRNFKFNLKKLELDTDYSQRMPLFNLDLLKLFGIGKMHLSLSDLSMNASFQVNLTAPFTGLKLSLGAAQFAITGFLNDPDFNKELSEDVTKGMASTVNTDGFAKLVENVLNAIVASFSKNKTVSSAEISGEFRFKPNIENHQVQLVDDMAAKESLNIIDLLSSFVKWMEIAFSG